MSVSYEKQAVFHCVIIFVGAGFEKTLIAPVASGVLSCSAVIMQQGAHLRQPCLLPEPRDWARCLGQHRKVSPMMHGPPLHSLGNNSRVTCCAPQPQTLPSSLSLSLSSLPSLQCHRMAKRHGASGVMSDSSCGNVITKFDHFYNLALVQEPLCDLR